MKEKSAKWHVHVLTNHVLTTSDGLRLLFSGWLFF